MRAKMLCFFAKSLTPFWYHLELNLPNLLKMSLDIEQITYIFRKKLRA